MPRYYVPLSPEEELNISQVAALPGFNVILKFLTIESLNAQQTAMEARQGTLEERAHALTVAQVTQDVCSNVTQKLAAYQQLAIKELSPVSEEEEDKVLHEFFPNVWGATDERTPS
jgi:hypothetical protein